MLISTLAYGLILAGGGLISVQLRLEFGFGLSLGDEYNPYPLLLWMMLLVGAVGAALIQIMLPSRSRLFDFMIGLVIATAGLMLFAPDISQLQVLYFFCTSSLIALLTLRIAPQNVSFRHSIRTLSNNRALLGLWIRYNVTSRYSQTTLGILWIVILPVTTALILSFVFSYIFQNREIGDVPFIAFFLSGLMFWSFFTQGVLNGTVSIISKLGLISQVYFPREILVITKLGEALIDLVFVFVVTLVINAIVGVYPNFNFIFLPLLLGIQIAMMLGIMFFLSYLTVFVRDIQQLTTVSTQMLFYLTPIMYPLTILPAILADVLGLLNPMAPLIDAYRDVILHNQSPDFTSLFIPLVLSIVLLYNGYMFFKANERKLADFQ
jgi:ABC-type polysaccharide/polyol phosphate export permease